MPDFAFPLLFLQRAPESTHYTPKRGRSPAPHRDDPTAHGTWLERQFVDAWSAAHEDGRQAAAVTTARGVYLEVTGQVGAELLVNKLEMRRDGIRLLSVHHDRSPEAPAAIVTKATIFIPEDKRHVLLEKITQYSDAQATLPTSNKRHHQDLMNGIEHIRLALLDSFWSDAPQLMPTDLPAWCEFWLAGSKASGVETQFRRLAEEQQVRCSESSLGFPERVVLLACVTKAQMLTLLSEPLVAEIRRAQETAEFWTRQPNAQQAEWSTDLLKRLDVAADALASVCILDSGVNNGHPLLSPLLADEDCHAFNPAWGTDDHHGHGSNMAGIVAYGNLEQALASQSRVTVRHRLESVKILPPPPHPPNAARLHGAITTQAISRAEIAAPQRLRTICMAVAAEGRDRGRPSSWSATVDALAAGVDDSPDAKRLIVLAAGNADAAQWKNYPDSNETDSVHNPGQSWNALTVGAYTEKTRITDPSLAGYAPVAMPGDMSPFSTTSLTWEERKWPTKPDIVLEGGNVAKDVTGFCSECDDLSLLTTGRLPASRVFEPFAMTSAAAAQASWLAAQLYDAYPHAWPETVRGLLVHAAKWTPAMTKRWPTATKGDRGRLLRRCGYGVPDLREAIECARSRFTLILQHAIQPYEKTKTSVRTKDMHLFELPWPKDILLGLGEQNATLRITLSYFIEPSPGEVGWKSRYRYPSHTLRFALQSPTESRQEFVHRINRAVREDGETTQTDGEAGRWMLGEHARNFGSIHSDICTAGAADIAACNMLAVYPLNGWWKERAHLGKVESLTRYSLIVSVKTDAVGVDIYTPVAIKIGVPIPVPVPVS